MNIINILRKPYLAIILSFLVLFTSCNQYENDNLQSFDKHSLEKFVKKHIKVSKELAIIYRNEKNIDIGVMEKSPDIFKNVTEFKQMLKNAKITHIQKVTDLVIELQENANFFISKLGNKNTINQDMIINKISDEIDKQLHYINVNNYNKSNCIGNCWSGFVIGQARCERNWMIGTTAVIIGGIISAGIGGVIGAVAVGATLALCTNDIYNDRASCLANCTDNNE